MGALAVVWAPVSTLARVAEERRVLLGFGVVALYAALGLVGGAIAVFGGLTQAQFQQPGAQPLPPGAEDFLAYFGIFSLVSAVVQPFVLWLLVSGLMQLVTRFFGGTGPFPGMLAVVGVAQVPLVIFTALYIPIAGLQAVLGPRIRRGERGTHRAGVAEWPARAGFLALARGPRGHRRRLRPARRLRAVGRILRHLVRGLRGAYTHRGRGHHRSGRRNRWGGLERNTVLGISRKG